jgi:hypothetical protein
MTRLGWLGPAQLCRLARSSPVTWAGLGPARKKKGIISKKIYEFSANFLYCILINSGLYFYIVKIQI